MYTTAAAIDHLKYSGDSKNLLVVGQARPVARTMFFKTFLTPWAVLQVPESYDSGQVLSYGIRDVFSDTVKRRVSDKT